MEKLASDVFLARSPHSAAREILLGFDGCFACHSFRHQAGGLLNYCDKPPLPKHQPCALPQDMGRKRKMKTKHSFAKYGPFENCPLCSHSCPLTQEMKHIKGPRCGGRGAKGSTHLCRNIGYSSVPYKRRREQISSDDPV